MCRGPAEWLKCQISTWLLSRLDLSQDQDTRQSCRVTSDSTVTKVKFFCPRYADTRRRSRNILPEIVFAKVDRVRLLSSSRAAHDESYHTENHVKSRRTMTHRGEFVLYTESICALYLLHCINYTQWHKSIWTPMNFSRTTYENVLKFHWHCYKIFIGSTRLAKITNI